jgi:predicted Zn-dependent protease
VPTPAGWPTLPRWCVWLEPAAESGPSAQWDQRWWRAVNAALTTWQAELPITLVEDPTAAQVLVWRRRPPIQNRRASHGRSQLALVAVRRDQSWRLEPRVEVLISPGQGASPLQATALHELGHAFGLWGHSDQPDDVLAVRPGARPVLALTPRDRATLRWLLSQPGLHQELLPSALTRTRPTR